MTYLLDANVFIQAKNLHYGLDFCPAFWEWLAEKNAAGIVCSIDKVADELEIGADDLTMWARQQRTDFFRKTDASVMPHFASVSTWVMGQSYEQAAIHTFLQAADYYLIAHALADGLVVVTHEVPANSPKKIKIPNVCAGLGLRFMTPYMMLKIEKARFVRGRA